ncbi:ribosome hibernation factor-recruiting GTPase MRF [Kutzneria buriramensis]|uniref:G3E family GTPase n=1 Tax=Kutzneria buriramensis TaxID=1045776 RepID=A0A3E0HBC0_9PSEU|nr:GTP-binding protein [Kutzneria buriramensis]REH41723.1 G3E family GTPase [Kutzneria buriramensis]
MSVPIVLVGGLAAAAAERVADELAGGDAAVVHHDLCRVTEGVVRRRLRHRGEDTWTVLELGHGCVSCTLREDLLPLVERLSQWDDVSRIVLHLDPRMEPEPICWALDRSRVQAVVTAVDHERWLESATGDASMHECGLGGSADDERTLAQVAVGQAEFADVLVLTGPAGRLDAAFRRLAPTALRVPLGGVEWLSDLPVNARRGRPDSAHGPLLRGEPPLHREDGFELLLFSERRPFHPERFHANIDVLLDGIVRTRGRFWLASRPDIALWLESAGGGLQIGHAGPWLAAVDDWSGVDDDRRAMAALNWDPYYGDRGNEIVVLTDGADHAEIAAALRDALVTDAELAAGLSARDGYRDPFLFTDREDELR